MFRYELYRPWMRYDALVFLKSMNVESQKIIETASRKECRSVFDLNVDYLTPAQGTFYYDGMAPTRHQHREALSMVGKSDAVIADSRWLRDVASNYTSRVCWIPDSIPEEFILMKNQWRPNPSEPLPLIWCGESVKLFELLRIEKVLRYHKKHVHLRIITNSLDSLKRIYEPWQSNLMRLLDDMNSEIVPFTDLYALMKIYDRGGIFISPRFLNNTYNMGHTEWKITLAMARGRMVLCSDQPSYVDVADRAQSRGIRICKQDDDWYERMEEILSGKLEWKLEQEHAVNVVRDYYSVPVVAESHMQFLSKVIESS